MKYISIIITILFVTYGQLIIKYEINKLGVLTSTNFLGLSKFFIKALTNIGILSGLFAAVIAALAWMYTMNKFDLSSVYPFLSINLLLVPFLSVYFFDEAMNVYKIAGILIIVIGNIIFSRGI